MKIRKRHVVLVQPGDLLLIGNVGPLDDEAQQELAEFFEQADIRVAVFENDIDMDVSCSD